MKTCININGIRYDTTESVVRNLTLALDGEPLGDDHKDTRAVKELAARFLKGLVVKAAEGCDVIVKTGYVPGKRYQLTLTATAKGTT